MKMGTEVRKQGWWTVGLLSLMLSTPGWALDLDHAIQHQNAEAAQIASTLKSTPQKFKRSTSGKTAKKEQSSYRFKKKKKIYFVMFKAPPAKKRKA